VETVKTSETESFGNREPKLENLRELRFVKLYTKKKKLQGLQRYEIHKQDFFLKRSVTIKTSRRSFHLLFEGQKKELAVVGSRFAILD
jgi:hypothetical protein